VTQCNDNNVAQVEFPGDVIPGTQINPVATSLLKYVPLPNIASAQNLAEGNNYEAERYGNAQPKWLLGRCSSRQYRLGSRKLGRNARYNKSCWQSIPSWGLGNLKGRTNVVRNPTISNVDLSLSKTAPIWEKLNLTLRLDAFNAFNSVLFGGPDTNPGDSAATFTPGAGWSGFGTVGPTQQNFPRVLQVSGKITF